MSLIVQVSQYLLAPQRNLTNADDNLDPKNENEEKLMPCITKIVRRRRSTNSKKGIFKRIVVFNDIRAVIFNMLVQIVHTIS
jgi:hypothetical protein